MVDVFTPEIASRLGFLDSAVATDGEPWHTLALRTLAMQANYQTTQGGACLSLLWDADSSADTGVLGALSGVGAPIWCPVTPALIVPKDPGRTHYEVTVTIATIGDIFLQFVSGAEPFNPSADINSTNVLSFTGGASLTTFATKQITFRAPETADFDTIQVWIRGTPTGTLATGGGTPNTGTITAMLAPDDLYASGGAWTLTGAGTSWAAVNALVVRNASAQTIMSHRLITNVPATNRLRFYPPTTLPFPALQGATYRIETLPTWRLSHIGIYTQELS